MKAREYLFEYNIYNSDELGKWLSSFAFDLDTDEAEKWFTKTLRKEIINNMDFLSQTPRLEQNAPEWAQQAMEKGELYNFDQRKLAANEELTGKITHVLDWIKYLEENDPQELNKLFKVKLDVAIQKADEWTATMNRQATDVEAEHGLKTVKQWEDGSRLVLILDKDRDAAKQCLDREGKLMGHCVGSYSDAVMNRGTHIYSLRDPQNNPHVTIEVRNGHEVYQIKGKQNQSPVARYIPFLKSFLTTTKSPADGELWDVRGDYRNLGLIKLGKQLWDPETDFPDHIEGNLTELRNFKGAVNFPQKLTVTGSMSLDGADGIASMPQELSVGGDLDLDHTQIKALPPRLTVGGTLHMDGVPAQEIPTGTTIGEDLHAANSGLLTIGLDVKIAGGIDLDGSALQMLPDGFVCHTWLDISDTKISKLPMGLIVKDKLYMGGTNIKRIPSDAIIGDVEGHQS